MIAPARIRSLRRVTALAAAFTLAGCVACTGPTTSKMVPGELTIVLQDPGAGAGFSSVRITLTRIGGETAVDTTVAYAAGSGSRNVTMNLEIDRAFFSSGEPLSMTLRYLGASGQTVFTASTTVTAKAR